MCLLIVALFALVAILIAMAWRRTERYDNVGTDYVNLYDEEMRNQVYDDDEMEAGWGPWYY